MRNTKQSQITTMKKVYALTKKRAVDLSLSENPLGCSPLVTNALNDIKIKFNSYPNANSGVLKKQLAKSFSLSENNFFIANGSESIINDLPRIFGKFSDEVVVPALSFPLFAICSKLANKKIVVSAMTSELGIDLKKMEKLVSSKTSLVFICNPNNPTGSILNKQKIIEFLNIIPKSVLLIVDEANIEFGGESMSDEVKNRKNLVILRTFSKAFGLASLRIGFAIANEKIINKMEEETPIFPTSVLSEKLAMIAIEDKKFIRTTKTFVAKQRGLLREQLKKMGFLVFPSEANNLFVKLPNFLDIQEFNKKLADQEISVIMGSSFVGFDDSFFRISTRDKKTNQLFLTKMEVIIGK